MNPSENPKFEQEWQRLFESASETPPPSAWEAIEKHLDEKEAVVIPLVWWKNPKVLYAAAAVAALLLVSWPLLQTGDPEIAATRNELASESSPTLGDPAPAASGSNRYRSPEQPAESAEPLATRPTGTSPADQVAAVQNGNREGIGREVISGEKTPRFETEQAIADNNPNRPLAPLSRVGEKDPAPVSSEDTVFPASSSTLTALTKSSRRNANAEVDQIIPGSSTPPLQTPALTGSIALLSPIGPSEREVYMQKRYVYYHYEVAEPELPKRSRGRELWAGLGIMPASFNPQVNVTSSPVAFTNAKASRQALASTSKAQLSYALQVQGGKKLSKRWSVETGLSYLQGNSTFESDGYVLNSITSRSANVLEDALLSSNGYLNNAVPQPGFAPSQDKNAASFIDLDQRTSNDYRYVQVPVQAGYTLNPDGKMNYTVLAGVVGNLFLQNEIQSAQGYSFKNTSDDGLYRSLNWSAATGVRVNYRLSDHWNASLTGSYQKAIDSILRDSPTLESRPRLYGMAWGVQYVF